MGNSQLLRLVVVAALLLCASCGIRPATEPVAAGPDPLDIAIDFSHAGYADGGVLPDIPSVLFVRPSGRDDTALLQAALDEVAKMPDNPTGFRGALQLSAGRFLVSGQLLLRHSGVVLRGSATPGQPTIITASGHGRRTLIEIGGLLAPTGGNPLRVTSNTVPAGACTLTLESVDSLKTGDRITIIRPSTASWIAYLGMDQFTGPFVEKPANWAPGSRNLVWNRVVAAVDAAQKQITIDAPLTTAIESRFGGATIHKVAATEVPISHIGIEDLILDSDFNSANAYDEEHSWIAIAMGSVEDAWVRRVVSRHFASSCVRVGPGGRRVSVEDCRCEQPVSEPGGYRRQSFLVEGQQVLVRHCFAEFGMNDFAVGLCAGGPNVFLDCTASHALGSSGAFESWASGTLYERVAVDGAGIQLSKNSSRALGGGWTAANSVVWNCQAKEFDVRGPEGAANIVVTSPHSLYYSQLARRLGSAHANILHKPPSANAALPEFHLPPDRSPLAPKPVRPLQIVNGRFVVDGQTVWGGSVNDAWWKGQPNPAVALSGGGVSITRFIPGRTGPGLTEDLPALAEQMKTDGTPFYQAGPPIWYDRRRDEHSIVQRADANVWAPFCEMPWARSGTGTGTAWDGLSRFDLTRYNAWYFDRTRQFADLCDQHGFVMYHTLYNTHNLQEWGAHWIDFPWRPANNINHTGLPEPPPFEPLKSGDLTIKLHVANQFYNVDDPERRRLHRDYIFHELDQLGSCRNVVFGLGFQFAGPLAFQQFFQDTVAEWERQSGRTVRLALVTSKDIEDAILADPVRAKQIAVIDLRYWQYRPDGSLWAPPGGTNLAFREAVARDFGKAADFPPPTTPRQLYRQVREYHDRFPDKAIVAWTGGVGPIPILMAGGAQALLRNPTGGHAQGGVIDRATLDSFVTSRLAANLMKMAPRDDLLADAANTWSLCDDACRNILIYSLHGDSIAVIKPLKKTYSGLWFNPRTGETLAHGSSISLLKAATITKPTNADWLLLLIAN